MNYDHTHDDEKCCDCGGDHCCCWCPRFVEYVDGMTILTLAETYTAFPDGVHAAPARGEVQQADSDA